MIIDGKEIAEEVLIALKNDLAHTSTLPTLTVLTCVPDFATRTFLDIKKRRAHELGISVEVKELSDMCTTKNVVATLHDILPHTDGVIVQLPFPDHIDIEKVLAALPESHDVDAIGSEAVASLFNATEKVLSPVVASIKLLAERHDLALKDKNVVVVGEGRLVGKPARAWFQNQDAHVTTLTKEHTDVREHTEMADILVLGAGVPNLVTPDMVKEGVVIFDAGTSEEGGKLVGDADSGCAEKASLFTPVPGGIGPITVAMIFKNLLVLARTS